MDQQAKAWVAELDGQVIGGRYRLGKPLGVGGMGAVFDGVHQTVGRRVAVKLLFPELTDNEETVRRFQQEAQSAAAIAKRGVVDILDFDRDPVHGPYLVMEKLRGESLLARIKTVGRLSPEKALDVAIQIADTLSEVHAQGIIHRDLKPANVFLAFTDEGEEVVKLLDFGISRVAPKPGSAPLTVPGTVLGTPRFMAPEQAACDPDVDHRADLYSVGAILYYAVSGVKPYHDVPTGSLLVAVLNDGPTPLRMVRSDLPQPVLELVNQALERDRERRFQSAEALRAALRHALERLEVAAHATPLTADDDFAPTAIDSRPDAVLAAAEPSSGRASIPDTLRRGPDDPRDDASAEQTAFELPRDDRPPPTAPPGLEMPKTVDVGRPATRGGRPVVEPGAAVVESREAHPRPRGTAPETVAAGATARLESGASDLRPGSLDQSGAHQIAPGVHEQRAAHRVATPTFERRVARQVGEAQAPPPAGPSRAEPTPNTPPKRKPWGWMVAIALVLVVLAVGVGLGGVVLGLQLWSSVGR